MGESTTIQVIGLYLTLTLRQHAVGLSDNSQTLRSGSNFLLTFTFTLVNHLSDQFKTVRPKYWWDTS